MFFTVLLFGAAPIVYDLAFAENPTERLDCNAPKTRAETSFCAAPGNLKQAQTEMKKSLENIRDR